jgi:hypothetical protein
MTPGRAAPFLALLVVLVAAVVAAQAPAPPPKLAVPAPPEVAAEVTRAVEAARQRFEARDTTGVLAYVSEQYRSGGLTKAGVRQQLQALFGLYQEMRARLSVDSVQVVDGATWVYTTGEVTGRLPFMGWMPVLSWQREPEVVRREGPALRLFGFQD